MERASPPATSLAFVRWEEVFVSSDKGRREVHYYLKRRDGGSDLAVIGKEKSLRHMSYHYAICNRSLLSFAPSSSLMKLRSRREVIDWLKSIVQDSPAHESSEAASGSLDSKDACEMDVKSFKDTHLRKLGQITKEFIWLGSQWTCRKRRKHYESFRRNGVKISVHDFVYVLAEEDKRLVAYLEDMYEDSRGNKMVVVRWFHKIDEVGLDLPHNFNDREIFFSLCLQDLSIECIDGLATVLSPQHFEKFRNEATHTQLEPFVCQGQFENDDVKPFDITQVKGYWKQEILRFMYTTSPLKDDSGLNMEENANDTGGIRPKKRHRRSKDSEAFLQCTDKKESMNAPCVDVQNFSNSLIDWKSGIDMGSLRDGFCAATLSGVGPIKQKHPQYLIVGSEVEVLSQDSGIRGCWFRALIIKKHKDKVKVRYQDIRDAADEANNLEEWILASKVAVPDQLGLRILGRTTIRPPPQSNKGRVSWVVDVGTAVDVWWHDGWWEGIVIQKEAEDKIHVYFPGEKRESIFGNGDLRHSQEWLGNRWKHMKERPDLVNQILSGLPTKQVVSDTCDGEPTQVAICDNIQIVKDGAGFSNSPSVSGNGKVEELEAAPDLSKDDSLAQLKWKSSRKRRRGSGSSVQRLHYDDNNCKSSPEAVGSRTCERFLITTSSLMDNHENCKYIRDSLFNSSSLTSLVMSR
ncbi:hypothetical protein L1049_005904 [Liquidambar formosana]|uniref:BAH domain-containing protein n=1 Tax=Liquidambar formosana TaxID=63359 RepID=A0AAP0WSF3_LIQFO